MRAAGEGGGGEGTLPPRTDSLLEDRALLCGYRLTMGSGGAIEHLVSENMAGSLEQSGACSLAGQGQHLSPCWMAQGYTTRGKHLTLTLTALLRNDSATPSRDPTVCTHICIRYPSFSTKVACSGKLVSPPTR